MEQNFKPPSLSYLYLLVVHEMMELIFKRLEESMIVDHLVGFGIENFDEVAGWIEEVGKLISENQLFHYENERFEPNLFWCNNMILRIRETRAKRGPKFSFKGVSNMNNMGLGLLHEELYREQRLLINIKCAEILTEKYRLAGGQKCVLCEDFEFNDFKDVEDYLKTKFSIGYQDQIARVRKYITQHDPTSSLEYYGESSSYKLHPLREELFCEVRSLINVKMTDLLTCCHVVFIDRHGLNQFKNVLQYRIKKVNKFLAKFKFQLRLRNSKKNSDWYTKKIEETKSLIDVLSQDLGSTISMFSTPESKPPLDDVRYTKIWRLQLPQQLKKGSLSSSTEEDSDPIFVEVVRQFVKLSFKSNEECTNRIDLKTRFYLQVVREYVELVVKSKEDATIMSICSRPNENFNQVLEWAKAVKNFPYKTRMDLMSFHNFFYGYYSEEIRWDSVWCKNVISKIRKLRAKRGPNFTFQRLDFSSSSQENNNNNIMPMIMKMTPREKFLCELVSLSHILLPLESAILGLEDDDEYCLEGWRDEVDVFFFELKEHSNFERDPKPNSNGWYKQKIEEARMLIAKCEPAFSLQSQQHHVGSEASSLRISLHEELCYEIRLLIRFKCVDLMTVYDMPIDDDDLAHELKKQLLKWINEVNKFLTEINLELGQNILDKSFDWYHNKIARSRMLIAERDSAFPLRSEDVGYVKNQYKIFLSFRGEDTRYGFTRNLYDALHQTGFNIFMDDRGLERGDSISQVLMDAIEHSELSIVIFSKNFANSTWCLDEILKILECNKQSNQLVLPVFYKVEPSEVRDQNNNYGEAMAKHEKRYVHDVIRTWRSALHQVCGFNAFQYKENSGYECDFIQSIVNEAIKIRDGI